MYLQSVCSRVRSNCVGKRRRGAASGSKTGAEKERRGNGDLRMHNASHPPERGREGVLLLFESVIH